MTCETVWLLSTSHLQIFLTHWLETQIRIVNGIQRKELGRRTGKRSSPIVQTPSARANTRVEVGNSGNFFVN